MSRVVCRTSRPLPNTLTHTRTHTIATPVRLAFFHVYHTSAFVSLTAPLNRRVHFLKILLHTKRAYRGIPVVYCITTFERFPAMTFNFYYSSANVRPMRKLKHERGAILLNQHHRNSDLLRIHETTLDY